MIKGVKKHWGITFAVCMLLFSVIVVLINGGDYYADIHDNLDSAVMVVLQKSHLFFAHGAKAPLLGGLDRDYLPSEFKLTSLFYMLLPPLYAYLACVYVKIVLAVVGWVLLFRQLGGEMAKSDRNIIVICGFLYGIILPAANLAAGTLPLVLALLLSIWHDPKPFKYVLLFLYPTLSEFAFFGIFICGYLLLCCIWLSVRRKPAARMWLALLVISAGSIAIEYRLMWIMLFHKVPSIHDEITPAYAPFTEVLRQSLSVFVKGWYHCGTLQKYVIVPTCGLYFVYINGHYIYKKQPQKIFRDPYNGLIFWAAFNASMYGAQSWRPLKELIASLVPPLAGFNISRTAWFNPFVWCLAFCLILLRLQKAAPPVRALAHGLPILACLIVPVTPADYNEFYSNTKAMVNDLLYHERGGYPTRNFTRKTCSLRSGKI